MKRGSKRGLRPVALLAALVLLMATCLIALPVFSVTTAAQTTQGDPWDKPQDARYGSSLALLTDVSYAHGDEYTYLHPTLEHRNLLNEIVIKQGLTELGEIDASSKVGFYTYASTSPAPRMEQGGYLPETLVLGPDGKLSPAVTQMLENRVPLLATIGKPLDGLHNMQAGLQRIKEDIEKGAQYTQVFVFTEFGPSLTSNPDGTPRPGFDSGTIEQSDIDRTKAAIAELAAMGVQVTPVGVGANHDDEKTGVSTGTGLRSYDPSPRNPPAAGDKYGFVIRSDSGRIIKYLTGPNLMKELASASIDPNSYYGVWMANRTITTNNNGNYGEVFTLRAFDNPGLTASVNVVDKNEKLVERVLNREVSITPITGTVDPHRVLPSAKDGFARQPVYARLPASTARMSYTLDKTTSVHSNVKCFEQAPDQTTWTEVKTNLTTTDSADGKSQEVSVSFHRKTNYAYHCAFLQRETAELKIDAQIHANTYVLSQLNAEEYGQMHLAYRCVDTATPYSADKPFVVEGTVSPILLPGTKLAERYPDRIALPHTVDQRVPVGADCTITQLKPRYRKDYFTTSTAFSLNGDAVDSEISATLPAGEFQWYQDGTLKPYAPTGEFAKDHPETKFEMTPAERRGASTVLVTTTYSNPVATQKVDITIDNPEVFKGGNTDLAPKSVWVEYSCRYIPDAGDRPELNPKDEAYPLVVPTGGENPAKVDLRQVGDKLVGSVELGKFPVGTQCGYSLVGQAVEGSSVNAPIAEGFSMSPAAWSSQVCMKLNREDDGYTVNPRQCHGNSTYLYPEFFDDNDTATMAATATFERNTRPLNITKNLAGAAGGDFTAKDFPVTLRCMQAGDDSWTIYDLEELNINSASEVVRKVPTGARCEIQEKDSSGGNPVDTDKYDFSLPGPVSVHIPDGSTEAIDATVTNTIEDHYGQLNLSLTLDTTNVDPGTDATGVDGTVNAVCVLPDGGNLRLERDLGHGDTWMLLPEEDINPRYSATKGLPIGTECTFNVRKSAASTNAEVVQKPGTGVPVSHTVTTGPQNVDLYLVLDEPTVDLEILLERGPVQVKDAATYLPEEYVVNYSCMPEGGGMPLTGSETISMSNPVLVVDGVRRGANCTVSVSEGATAKPYAEAFTRMVEFRTGANPDAPVPGAGPEGGSFTGIVSSEIEGSRLWVDVTYNPIMVPLNLAKNVRATLEGAAQPMAANDPIYQAMFKNPEFAASVKCIRNGETLVDTPATMRAALAEDPAQAASLQVPAGSECEVTEAPRSIASAGEAQTSVVVNGSSPLDASTFTHQVATGVGALPIDATFTNAYTITTGTVHVKKKVDGTGVGTVSAEKQFPVDWRCTLGGSEVASGTLSMGRFDQAVDKVIEGIPLGAQCELSEDYEKIKDPEANDPANQLDGSYSVWSARWTVDESPSGFGVETPCAQYKDCSPGAQQQIATFAVNKSEFNYTAILWNTYDYKTVPLGVTKQLDPDQGQKLANNENVGLRPARGTLTCTHPRFKVLSADRPYLSDPTITAQVVFPAGGGAGMLTYIDSTVNNTDPNAGGDQTVTRPEMTVPANYVCTFTEDDPQMQFEVDGANGTKIGIGATVDTTFASTRQNNNGAPVAAADPVAVPGKRAAEFGIDTALVVDNTTVDGAAAGDRQTLVVGNRYTLDNTALSMQLRKKFGVQGDVSPYLGDTINPNVVCTDPLLGTEFSFAPALTDGADPTELGRVTVGTTCAVTSNAGALRAGQDFIELGGEVFHRDGAGAEAKVLAAAPIADTLLVQPLNPGADLVTIEPSYFVRQVQPSVTKDFQGFNVDAIVQPEDKFDFSYRCTFANLVHGQPEPFAREGNFQLSRENNDWAAGEGMPVGSECVIAEAPAPEGVQQLLDAHNVRMVPYYTTLDANGEPLVHPLGAGATLNEEMPSALITNGIYRDDAEIQVQKVQADLKTALGGAQFAIHSAKPDGTLGEKVADMETTDGVAGEVSHQFTTRLSPGTYYLVETKAAEGASLLPGAWKFTVTAENGQDLADLQVSIAGVSENSGLITLVEAKPEKNKPAIIQVANVMQGKLPLTGSSTLLFCLILGIGLGGSAIWMRNRKE